MALLTSGVSAAYTGTSASATVAVTAGAGNRKLIVGFAMESNVTVTALTFNGQDLVALGLEIPLTDISTDSASRCIMFEQFDAGLPASGDTALAATFSGSATGGGRMFYWLVDGVRQDQVADGASGQVVNGATPGPATFQTDETFIAGDDDRALFAVAYRNDNETSILLTTPSSATHIDAAGFTIAGGGRVNGSSKVGSMGTGTVRPTWTTQTTGQDRRTGCACMLNAAADEASVDGALSFPAEIAGTLSSPRNVDGALSFPVSIDVDANFLIEAGDGALSFPAQVAGSLSVPANLSGALSFGWGLDGENALDVEGTVLFGALSFPAQVAGALSVPANADGALSFPVSLDVDADFIIEADAALEFGWEIAGTLAHVASVDGALSFPVQVSGRVRTQFHGSCVLLDEPAGSASLEHADAGFATLLDEPSGSATLEFE
jgi:hypothetical protein